MKKSGIIPILSGAALVGGFVLHKNLIDAMIGVLPLPPPSIPTTSASANWSIPANSVADANYCYGGGNYWTPLTFSNYTNVTDNMTILSDGTIQITAGTYNIGFSFNSGNGPAIVYMYVHNAVSGKSYPLLTNADGGSKTHNGICTVDGVYNSQTWWNYKLNQYDEINFYLADYSGNSNNMGKDASGTPIYQGSLSFDYKGY